MCMNEIYFTKTSIELANKFSLSCTPLHQKRFFIKLKMFLGLFANHVYRRIFQVQDCTLDIRLF